MLSGSLVASDVVVLERSGPDAILTAGEDGVLLWEYDEDTWSMDSEELTDQFATAVTLADLDGAAGSDVAALLLGGQSVFRAYDVGGSYVPSPANFSIGSAATSITAVDWIPLAQDELAFLTDAGYAVYTPDGYLIESRPIGGRPILQSAVGRDGVVGELLAVVMELQLPGYEGLQYLTVVGAGGQLETSIALEDYAASGLDVLDLDGDGGDDLVLSSAKTCAMTLYWGQPFKDHQFLPDRKEELNFPGGGDSEVAARCPAFVDFDGDFDIDVVGCYDSLKLSFALHGEIACEELLPTHDGCFGSEVFDAMERVTIEYEVPSLTSVPGLTVRRLEISAFRGIGVPISIEPTLGIDAEPVAMPPEGGLEIDPGEDGVCTQFFRWQLPPLGEDAECFFVARCVFSNGEVGPSVIHWYAIGEPCFGGEREVVRGAGKWNVGDSERPVVPIARPPIRPPGT